ncbi:MAG: hypothetical protein U0Q16_31600 [Bryobacteraceae bacterium]
MNQRKPSPLGALLCRGRHTPVTALCAIFAVTLAPVSAQTTITPLTINQDALNQLTITPGTLTPESIGLLSGTTTSAPEPKPVTISGTILAGKGVDIAASANGSVWIIGTDYAAWQWSGSKFIKMPALDLTNSKTVASRIAVSPDGVAFVVDNSGAIWWYSGDLRVWTKLVGTASDIAIGSDGTMCIVTPTGAVQKWDGKVWQTFGTINDTAARRIAVDPFGSPWVMGTKGGYRWNKSTFEKLPFGGYDIAIGGDGAVWAPMASPGGAGHLQWWNGSKLVEFPGLGATFLAVDGIGSGYVIDANLTIYRVPLPGPVALKPDVRSTSWANIGTKGKLLCSASVEANDCGRALATYVGKHTLSTTCSSGFYDPIYGGTCWKCPDDDGSGGWIRSLDSITSSTACWRSPKESLVSATKVKSPGWAWQCPDGSFWDGYSPDGAGGSCWSCPSDHPRRTGFSIWESKACASPSNQTNWASMIGYNGCPKPDRDTLGFAGMKQPGQPFLDVGAGGCFACPVVAKDGTFLITVRNGVALYKQDDETDVAYTSTKTLTQGCDVAFRYQPSPFWQPGLASMGGALEVITDARLFEYPDMLTGYLYALADAKGLTGADATTYVTNAWTGIAKDPINSVPLRAVAYLMLQGAARKGASLRSQSEQKLIDSFARYILERRAYYAQQALDMYDAWKANRDAFESSIAKSPLQRAFSYGTVPFDFKNTMTAIAGSVGGAGLTALGMAAAYNLKEGERNAALDFFDETLEGKTKPTGSSPSKAVEAATKTARLSKPPATTPSSLTKVVTAVRTLGTAIGATLVGTIIAEIAVGILIGIAANQLMQIETARPELVVMLDKARQPVDVPTLMSTDDGRATTLLFWGQAMDVTEPAIPGLTTMAQEAAKWAAARKYARPKGI